MSPDNQQDPRASETGVSRTSIASIVAQVIDLFRRAKENFESSGLNSSDESPSKAIKDYEGRFRVWCGNVGAHQTGKSSLGNRLRDAPNLTSKVLRLLQNLRKLLLEANAIISGQRKPAEQETYDSSSDSSDEEPLSEDEDGADGELAQILSEFGDILDCLYRMSMNLRSPGGNKRFAKAAKIDVTYFEHFDIQYVQQVFPSAEEYLSARLGKAISRRRQFLKYQEQHATKLAQGIDPSVEETAQSETTASTLVEDSPAVTAVRSSMLPTFADDMSMVSATSYATVPGSMSSIKWPSLPKASKYGSPYECPFCHVFIDAQSTHEWRKHLVRDLHPYICTFEGCKTATEMYDTRREWFQHEMECHRQIYICINHCGKEFRTRSEFAKHSKKFLPSLTDAQMKIFLRVCGRPIDTNALIQCPLCNEDQNGSIQLGKHIARHLEEIGLRALPILPDDYGSGSDSGNDPPDTPSDPNMPETSLPKESSTSSGNSSQQATPIHPESSPTAAAETLQPGGLTRAEASQKDTYSLPERLPEGFPSTDPPPHNDPVSDTPLPPGPPASATRSSSFPVDSSQSDDVQLPQNQKAREDDRSSKRPEREFMNNSYHYQERQPRTKEPSDKIPHTPEPTMGGRSGGTPEVKPFFEKNASSLSMVEILGIKEPANVYRWTSNGKRRIEKHVPPISLSQSSSHQAPGMSSIRMPSSDPRKDIDGGADNGHTVSAAKDTFSEFFPKQWL